MIQIRNFTLILFVFISCSKSEKAKIIDDKKLNKYSIIYTNNSYANLMVFDNNDTIYVSNKVQSDINKYTKILSDKDEIDEIKKVIINHLSYKTLMIERDFTLHSGYLDVSVSCGDRKIQLIQSEVYKDLRVSKSFYNMIDSLKQRHKQIEDIFY